MNLDIVIEMITTCRSSEKITHPLNAHVAFLFSNHVRQLLHFFP